MRKLYENGSLLLYMPYLIWRMIGLAGSLFTNILDVSNNCFSTDQMGEQVSWIPWRIVPGDNDGTDF